MATPTASPRRWDTRRTAKGERMRAGAAYSDGQGHRPGPAQGSAAGRHPPRRPRGAGGRQPEAGRLPVAHPGRLRPEAPPRPAHADLVGVALPSTSTCSSAASPPSSTSPTPGRRACASRSWSRTARVDIGAIHTYVELYARMFVDLAPDVVLLCAEQADRDGNLYTGPNTEDTPTIAEAAAFHDGMVIVQVNEIVDDRAAAAGGHSRATGSTSWSQADRPFFLEPLFTRDPRHIGPVADPAGDDRDPRRLRTAPGGRRSTTASASTPPRSNCSCRPTASSSA